MSFCDKILYIFRNVVYELQELYDLIIDHPTKKVNEYAIIFSYISLVYLSPCTNSFSVNILHTCVFIWKKNHIICVNMLL